VGQFKITETGIDGLVIIEPEIHTDQRGYFMETYNARDLKDAGLPLNFVQDNHSRSIKGVLRGLHFQKQHPQGKLVRVVAGSIYDVAVDLRPTSPSFKRWFGVVLSSSNRKQLYIPRGFAHGFLALSEAEVIYKCTDYYDPEDEDGIIWNDPEIGIKWPDHGQIIISVKDTRLGNFEEERCAIDCFN